MVKFEGKIGTLYTTIFNAQKRFLKNSPHDVQTKGGGGAKGLLNNVKKNCTFLSCQLPLDKQCSSRIDFLTISSTFVKVDKKWPPM